jgi:hypothetical protein
VGLVRGVEDVQNVVKFNLELQRIRSGSLDIRGGGGGGGGGDLQKIHAKSGIW